MNDRMRNRSADRRARGILVAALWGLAAALPAWVATPTAAAAGEPADAYVLRVDGLACPYCAYGIEKQFGHMPGVTGTDVNLAAGTVLVHVQPGVRFERAQIEKTVRDAGFTLKGIVSAPAQER